MKTIFNIRVVLDVVEDVFRDIEIEADAPLTHLHAATLDAFGWQGDEMASFFRSNEQWDRGEEIPLMSMPDAFEEEVDALDFEEMDLSNQRASTTPSMEGVAVEKLLCQINDRAIYVYDFLRMWCFYVELISISKADEEAQYPRLVAEFGEAPTPESRELDLSDLGGLGGLDDYSSGKMSTGDAELDAYLNHDEDDEDEPGYTSLDDLDHDLY